MKIIYKYELEVFCQQYLKIKGFQSCLKVAEQNGKLCLWVIEDDNQIVDYVLSINIVGTGGKIDEDNELKYFDTVLMSDGMVWHIFID